MKKLAYALLLTGLVGAPTVAMAAEEESAHKLSANVTLTSDYLFRGISQTGGDAAIQGGFDYTHSSGFYLGTWASNVGWIEDFQGYGSGNMEIDLYGGFRGSFAEDFTFDVGAIQYWYPGKRFNTVTSTTAVDADTTELYGALGWKWFTVKYSYYLSDEVFGFANADGSDYLAISGAFPIGESGFTVGASWGTFNFDNNPNQDYDDWSISGTYDMGKLSKVTEGVTVGLKYTDTNADRAFWTDANGEFLGDDTVAVWVTKAF